MTRALLLFIVGLAPAAAKDSCQECHAALEGDLQKPALAWSKDIHRQQGFTCAACHGGNPNSDDPTVAMDRAHGFKGKPARNAVAQLCAHCHSDANLMRQYNPRERVDQYAEYLTSVHGKLIAAGDTTAATCIDCHGVHDILSVKDPLAPVYPLRLPGTCARCHSNATLMAKYKIPTDQYALYKQSVHWQALSERGDRSAPTCASCHGNHGAVPPQVTSVAAVCGTCHALVEELYQKSPHSAIFASMKLGGCVVCHSNHLVKMPSTAMLGGPNAVCKQCHDPDSDEGKTAARMAGLINGLDSSLKGSDEILQRAANSGMEVSEAVLKLQEGRDDLVKATVAVHTLDLAQVRQDASAGLAIAAEGHRAGVAALREREVRRLGLLVSLVAIAITILGLWFAVRSIERPGRTAAEPPRR
jgi:hypothetical protein